MEMKLGEVRVIVIRELEKNGYMDVFEVWDEILFGVVSIG